MVPPEFEKATAAPPAVSAFPAASFACSVTAVPVPDTIEPAPTVITDVAAEITPAETVIVGSVDVTGLPLIVAPIVVGVPAATAVKVAV